MFPHLGSGLNIFLMIMGLWEEEHTSKTTFSLHTINTTVLAADFDYMAEEVLVRFLWQIWQSNCQVLILFSLHTALFRRKSWGAVYTSRTDSLFLHPWEGIMNYLEFSHRGGLSLHPLLLIRSLIYISMNSWVFYTLCYKTILPYFIVQVFPALATGSSFSWPASLSRARCCGFLSERVLTVCTTGWSTLILYTS